MGKRGTRFFDRLKPGAVVLLAGATLAGNAFAATDGALDGAYQCQTRMEERRFESILTINSYRDGRAVYLIMANDNVNTGVYGYGLGRFGGNRFTGNTSFNYRFDLSIGFDLPNSEGYNLVTLQGTLGVLGSYGRPVAAHVDCKRVW